MHAGGLGNNLIIIRIMPQHRPPPPLTRPHENGLMTVEGEGVEGVVVVLAFRRGIH